MMKTMLRHSRGTVLVLSLLILLVLTIIGVASMSSVFMQERMAGNVNLQSLAFEAASAGLSEALEFGIDQIELRSGARIGDCSDKGNNLNNPKPEPWRGDLVERGTLALAQDNLQGVTVHYQLKTDCLLLPAIIDSDSPEGWVSVPQFESYVTSRGEVRQGNEVLAAREIEVRIDGFRRDGLSAMRIEGQAEIVFEAGNSNSFVMNGQGGPAISTPTAPNSMIISDELVENDRVQNFVGGVATTRYPPPFHDGAELAKFVSRIRAYMEHFQARGAPLPECNGRQMRFVNGNLALGGSDTFHGITYVTGNVTMSGTPNGSGLLIAEGTIQWTGGAFFEGLAINLGGRFRMSGGGGGATTGMIYNTNLDLDAIRPSGTGETGAYLLYNPRPGVGDFNWVNDVLDPLNPTPWFDTLVSYVSVDGDGNVIEKPGPFHADHVSGEILQMRLHDPAIHTNYPPTLIPGIVSKLEKNVSVPDPVRDNFPADTHLDKFDGFKGLAYHRLYSGCVHDDPADDSSWLAGLDANGGGEHTCKDGEDGFGATAVIFDGGGNHSMTYDCADVDSLRLALAACPLPSPCLDPYSFECIDPDWEPPVCDPSDPQLRKNCPLSEPLRDLQCDVPGRGGRIEAITSWRENIGWREALAAP